MTYLSHNHYPKIAMPIGWRTPRRPLYLRPLVAVMIVFVGGCAHLGTRIEQQPLPPGAPAVNEVLGDLAANDAAVDRFQATGGFELKTPEIDRIYTLQQSSISFRRPSELYVVGRRYGHAVLRLRCSGPAFLIEFPRRREYIYRPEGERFDSVKYPVSPADIAREMFLPEDWAKIPEGRARLTAYDEERQTATLALFSGPRQRHPGRILQVQGKPWVVIESQLFDRDGTILAITRKGDYHERGGIRFPKRVECIFPGENAHMRFEMREFALHRDLDDAWFRIPEQLAELRRLGFREVEPQEADWDAS